MQALQISGHTDIGQQRKDNQDAFICEYLWSKNIALIAVIDGVGGYAGGDKAAGIAKESIRKYMSSPKGDMLTMLREAIVFANNQIVEEKNLGQFPDMCCVITAAVVDVRNAKFYFAHIGDTRLYKLSKRKLKKITNDHSLVGAREDAGEISEYDAMNHPQRNIILREAGSRLHRIDDEEFLEYGEDDFLQNDILLICSDGLSDMVSSGTILQELLSNTSPVKKISNLIGLANKNGGKDNITIVFAQNNLPAKTGNPKKKTTAGAASSTLLVAPEIKNLPGAKTGFKKGAYLITGMLVMLALVSFIAFFKNSENHLIVSKVAIKDSVSNAIKKETVGGVINPVNMSTEKNITPVPGSPVDSLIITKTTAPGYIKDSAARNANSILFIGPSKNFDNELAALEITRKDSVYFPHDTLVLKNLHFKNFKTGIKITVPIIIQLDNTLFENVKRPFYFDVKNDSKKSFFVVIKNNR